MSSRSKKQYRGHSWHGHAAKPSPEYKAWQSMLQRCENTLNEHYKDYGGRGITVCERWQKFENFYADMGPRSPGLSLDRKDNNKNYEPNNCRWITIKEQQSNRRNNRWMEFRGIKLTISGWAEFLGVTRRLLQNRIDLGWNVERIITTPKRGSNQNVITQP